MKYRIRHLLLKYAYIFYPVLSVFLPWIYLAKCSKDFKHKIPYFKKPNDLRSYLVESESLTDHLHFFEFGVSRGWGLQNWLRRITHPDTRFYGFDTFEGIPEDWGNVKKGAYSAQGKMPHFEDKRVTLYKGLFQETLPDFMKSIGKPSQICFYHLDADLYSSTLYVLLQIQPVLKPGDILLFDEYFSITKSDHEYRAFEDFLFLYPLRFVPLAKSPNQFAIKIV